MMRIQVATWLFTCAQDLRYCLHFARLVLLRTHDEMHPARASIHAQRTLGEWAADSVASFAGSWLFVGLHVVWFAVWLVLHLDINLLTLIVSLEAIFLATFVLMSQNRGAARDRSRDDVEAAEVDELTEINRRQIIILQELRALAGALDGAAPGQPSGQAVDSPQPSQSQAGQAPHMRSDALSGPTGSLTAKNRPAGKANLRNRPA